MSGTPLRNKRGARSAGHLFGAWAFLCIACGAAFTFAYRSNGGEAYAFLALAIVGGIFGGAVFTALCQLRWAAGPGRVGFVVSGIIAAAIVLAITELPTLDERTWNIQAAYTFIPYLLLGALIGLAAGKIALRSGE